MQDTYFPELDEFHDKFCKAVIRSGIEQDFTKKWGLNALRDCYDILSNNVQGGYESHKRTMLSAPTGGTVLNIGPGMGFCVFLLAELFDAVLVAEPDSENCLLLGSIARHYQTRKGKPADEIVKIYQAGISITAEAVNYWNMKRTLMKKRNLKGSILNFIVEGAGELSEILQEKVSRVYLHKVLSSLSISNAFADIISRGGLFLADRGVMTWSEPEYVFEDILQIEGKDALQNSLLPIFEKNNMQCHLESYQLSNTDKESKRKSIEMWTLLKAWRSNK